MGGQERPLCRDAQRRRHRAMPTSGARPTQSISRLLACVGGAFLRAQGNGLSPPRVTINTARSARKKPLDVVFLTLPALTRLASARIAVLREPSMAAYAVMAIAASDLGLGAK